MPKSISPELGAESFACPHCGAHAHQNWFKCWAKPVQTAPFILDEFKASETIREMRDPEAKRRMQEFVDLTLSRKILLDGESVDIYRAPEVINLHLAQCYSCKAFSLWLYDRIIWPEIEPLISANDDIPEDILRDFNEAVSIVQRSPRGAAALLRLCVQKLCAHLGEKGKNIDEDIANLVRKGLDSRIQQSLDVIRVIGNEAVHPGVLDLRDDRETALKLFDLINLIVEATISQPKRVGELYSKLPQGKIEAIERRDTPKLIEPPDKNEN